LIEHENHLPKLQLKGESFDKSTQEKDTPLDNTDEWLQLLDETSPIDMLASWSGSEPTQSQKNMIEELIDREKMSFGVINILLQFVMLKEDMKLPKSYIFEIASNWKKKDIKTAKQAYNYALQVNQPKSYDQNFKGNRNYSRQNKQLISKEKTPKWLENREAQSNTSVTKDSTTKDEKLEKDRKAFLERLNKKWEEGNE